MAERSIAIDCRSIAFGLRRFESCPAHHVKNLHAIVALDFDIGRVVDSNREPQLPKRKQRFLVAPATRGESCPAHRLNKVPDII